MNMKGIAILSDLQITAQNQDFSVCRATLRVTVNWSRYHPIIIITNNRNYEQREDNHHPG